MSKFLLNFSFQLQKLQDSKILSGNDSSVKSLEEENKSLKNKITLLELAKSEKKSEISGNFNGCLYLSYLNFPFGNI